jgi:hypothetical protein
MQLELKRHWLTLESSIGELFVDGVFECFTLEDRYRPPPEPKVPRETCIPVGEYEVVITHSPRFGVLMPLVLNVPGFEGVRIHPGNTARDTDGCILVGHGRAADAITQSRVTYDALFNKLRAAIDAGQQVHLAVSVEPH